MKASLLRIGLIVPPLVLLIGAIRLLIEAPFAWDSVDRIGAGIPTLFCLVFSVPAVIVALVALREVVRRSRSEPRLIVFHLPLGAFLLVLGVMHWLLSSRFTDASNYYDFSTAGLQNAPAVIDITALALGTIFGAVIASLLAAGASVVYWQSLTPRTRFDDLPMQPDATGALIAEDARRHRRAAS